MIKVYEMARNQDGRVKPLVVPIPIVMRFILDLTLQLSEMSVTKLAKEVIALYERHGWTLRRVLLTPETRAQLSVENFNDATIVDSDFDALWFARASNQNREAWELRLLSENPYALFEAFEADETEEDREDARREMENRMREHAQGSQRSA